MQSTLTSFFFNVSYLYTYIRYLFQYMFRPTSAYEIKDSTAEGVVRVTRHLPSGKVKVALIVSPNATTDPFRPIKPVWWFIGAKLKNGDEVCMTDVLFPYQVAGNVITRTLMASLNPEIENDVAAWIYLDAATFEQMEIPAEGITLHGVESHTEDVSDSE